jgi:hypothetical protein
MCIFKTMTTNPGMMAHAYNPSYSRGEGRRIAVSDWSRQKCKTLPEKQTKSKSSGDVGQVVGPLKALSSIPSTVKKPQTNKKPQNCENQI